MLLGMLPNLVSMVFVAAWSERLYYNLVSEAALPMPLYLIWNQDLFQYLVLSGFLLSCHFKAVPTYRESSDVNLIQKNFALTQSNLIMSISQN